MFLKKARRICVPIKLIEKQFLNLSMIPTRFEIEIHLLVIALLLQIDLRIIMMDYSF